jgi:hypothetical protein
MHGLVKLSDEQYRDLLVQERNLTNLTTEFDKFEQCGGECQQLRAIASEQLTMIQRMIKTYGPQNVNEG